VLHEIGPLAHAELLSTTGTTHRRKLQAVDLTGAIVSGVMTLEGFAGVNLFGYPTINTISDEFFGSPNEDCDNFPGGGTNIVIGPSTCECNAAMSCTKLSVVHARA
jgi:hypothetical protein